MSSPLSRSITAQKLKPWASWVRDVVAEHRLGLLEVGHRPVSDVLDDLRVRVDGVDRGRVAERERPQLEASGSQACAGAGFVRSYEAIWSATWRASSWTQPSSAEPRV